MLAKHVPSCFGELMYNKRTESVQTCCRKLWFWLDVGFHAALYTKTVATKTNM